MTEAVFLAAVALLVLCASFLLAFVGAFAGAILGMGGLKDPPSPSDFQNPHSG